MTLLAPRRIAIAAVLAATLTAAGCGGGTPTSPAPLSPREVLSVKLTTAHFQLLADRTEPSWLQHVADTLESAHPRITSDLHTEAPPQTSVHVWADSVGYLREQEALGRTLNPDSRGWVINYHLFSIRADTGSAAALAECAVHEFAHIVSNSLNARGLSGIPIWLREAVAMYEAGQFYDPMRFEYMRNGQYPTLEVIDAGLDAGVVRVWHVGYLLAEYIVKKWGTQGLVLLIRSSGDVSAAFGISVAAFESGWYAFLHEKYGTPAP